MSTTKKSLLLFWRANWAHKALFIGAILSWTTGLIMLRLAAPIIVAQAINKLVAIGTQSNTNYVSIFASYVMGYLFVAVIAQLLIESAHVLISKLETIVQPELQMRIFNALTSQSLKFHNASFSGALVSQTNKFTNAYISLTDIVVLQVISMGITAGGSVIVLLFYMPLAGICMMAWTVSFVWLTSKLTRSRLKYSRTASAAESILTAHLADVIGNILAVKSFGQETHECQVPTFRNT